MFKSNIHAFIIHQKSYWASTILGYEEPDRNKITEMDKYPG